VEVGQLVQQIQMELMVVIQYLMFVVQRVQINSLQPEVVAVVVMVQDHLEVPVVEEVIKILVINLEDQVIHLQ
tara:strand:- start:284 stop:502 length:219 start_codon:yes stop_codon:yes gene_type:complete